MTNEELLLERLARIEERLEGVARVEKQLEVFAKPWETLTDLGKDLSILMDPAARRLTEELVEVEIGFQMEDFFALIKRLLPNLRYISWALEQLENFTDWWADMEPILKIAVPKMIDQLDVLEQQQVFKTFGKMFSGEMLQFMDRLADVALATRLQEAKPVGPLGLLWQMRSPECRQGLGVLLELTRALNRMRPETAAAS
ncbi:MAG: helical membrane plugin domain-containing protein [Desulfobaccales bacterium]